MSEGTKLALRAALNVLRGSIETRRMASGLALGADALAMHAATNVECERLLAAGGAHHSNKRHMRRWDERT